MPGLLKSGAEIERMRLGAVAIYRIFRELSDYLAPGRSTAEVERFIDRALNRSPSTSALFGYRGFPAVACVSVNAVAAHGLPDRTMLCSGDMLSVDIATELEGWKSDATWTYGLIPTGERERTLIEAAWACTRSGLIAARAGGRVGDIGEAIMAVAEARGCSVIDTFAGHALGRELHEEPLVPHTGRAGTGELIEAGMVLNVEPIVTFGVPEVEKGGDGWSYRTIDGEATAQFELTVAVLEGESRVLTLGGIPPAQLGELPPFY
ncbi:MAG: type I methionyl aminopeptidase [Alkalispirochaetaceae bacterium]